jgi:NADPH:quinone reductase-like Zn-dependent oxidoreductase
MKAVVLEQYGGPDRLQLREVPAPRAGPGELRVRVAAASINPVDWKLRSGALQAWMPLQLPAVLGRDVSGEVLEVGPGVVGHAPGDRVLGLVRQGYAEEVVAPLSAWAQLPAGLDLRDAAALPLVVLTGAQLVEEAVNVTRGQTVLVTGALGGVGRAALWAARQRGARVLAGVRARQRAEAAALPVDGVVALDEAGDLAALPPLDAIADTVGGQTTARLLPRVKPGGVVGSVVGEPPGARERGLTVRAMMTHPDPQRLRALAEAVARGELAIPIARRFPLAQAAEAQALAEAGGVGKVLLLP